MQVFGIHIGTRRKTSLATTPRRARPAPPTAGLRILVPFVAIIAAAAVLLASRPVTLGGVARHEGTGEPLAGVVVTVGDQAVATDTAGRWQAVVPRGAHVVSFSAPGFVPFALDVVPGALTQRMGGLDAALATAGAWGVVRDALTGEPVEGALLQGGGLQAWSDAVGQFALDHLPEGVADFALSAPGYHPAQVQVAAPAGAEPLAFALQPVALSGTVTDARSGAPLAGVPVRLGAREATTDEKGQFHFVRVNGTEPLSVAPTGYTPASVPVDPQAHLSSGQPLAVALEPTELWGQVTDARTGNPVIAAQVLAAGRTATTDAEGAFVLYAVPEQVTVHVEAPGYDPADATARGQEPLDIRLKPRFTVVQVTDNLGAGLAGVDVSSPRGTGVTDAQGFAFLPLLREGETVSAARAGYGESSATYQGESLVALSLRAPGISGQVLDAATGQPVAGASVQVGDTLIWVDGEGRFRLNFVPAETMVVMAAGYLKAATGATTGLHEALRVQSVECAEGIEPPCQQFFLTPFAAQGIYVPFGLLHVPSQINALLDMVDSSPLLNMITVDVKGDYGRLAWDSQVPLAQQIGAPQPTATDLRALVDDAHRRGIYIVARMVIFKDHPLATTIPDYAVRRADGSVWTDGEDLAWANPFLPVVWDYNVELAKEVAALGFDEVQMDYVRFPSDGYVRQVTYPQEATLETKTAAIREFTRRFGEAMRYRGVFSSADVFGLTVWVVPETDMGIGQRVMDVAPNVDYLAPMIYPQTFGPGNGGFAQPWKWPYEIVSRSIELAKERVPARTRVRPWLQAYGCCGKDGYTVAEKMIQRMAADHAGSTGWTYWHAGGNYPPEIFGPLPALEELQAQVAAATGR